MNLCPHLPPDAHVPALAQLGLGVTSSTKPSIRQPHSSCALSLCSASSLGHKGRAGQGRSDRRWDPQAPKLSSGTAPQTPPPASEWSFRSQQATPADFYCLVSKKWQRAHFSTSPLRGGFHFTREAVCGSNCRPQLGPHLHVGRVSSLRQATSVLRSTSAHESRAGSGQVRRRKACRRAGVSPPQPPRPQGPLSRSPPRHSPGGRPCPSPATGNRAQQPWRCSGRPAGRSVAVRPAGRGGQASQEGWRCWCLARERAWCPSPWASLPWSRGYEDKWPSRA